MRERFERQLDKLNTELISMGALCEDAISSAVKFLFDKNEALFENAAEAEKLINRKEREIEDLCMRLLIQQQPVAADLRVISAAIHMTRDMERIGDQAYDIAEISRYVKTSNIGKDIKISEMAETASKMVTDSIESFVKSDVAAAQKVTELDDRQDGLFAEVKNELIAAVESKTREAETLIDLLMIAKYFERIGDHAVNIAEWVIYSVTGEHK